MSLTRLQLFALLLLAQVSFGAQSGDFKNSPQRSQRGKAPTKCRFFASLRMTCHPERSEGSAFLRAPRRNPPLEVQSLPVSALSVLSVPSVVNLFFSSREDAAGTSTPENYRTSESFDLRDYIAELERWSALASRLEAHPEQAGALRKQLPDSWSVAVQEQRFSVSTRPLGEALDRMVRDPSTAARSAQEISGRVGRLLDDARTTYRTSKRNYSPERSMLDQILKQREFRSVHEEADSETFWNQLLDRLWQWVAGLLDRAGTHPKVTNFLRWGIVILLGLILLGWLAHALTQVSYQRSPALAGDTRAAPARDWAQEARSAAARGEFREAIRLIYGAAVLALGEAGAWQVDRSRTHREYVRLLPADSARRPHLIALTDCFERVWYGRAPASDSDYEAALAEWESLR